MFALFRVVCTLQFFAIAADGIFAQNNQTQSVRIYFGNRVKNPGSIECGKGFPVERTIRRQHSLKNMVRAVLNELLRGPTESEQREGFYSSIPSPSQIRSYKEQLLAHVNERPNPLRTWREDDTVVTVRRVIVVRDSVFVEFSHSMRAYGGGSCRVAGILGPMWQTLSELRGIRTVGWAIEGSAPQDSLQP